MSENIVQLHGVADDSIVDGPGIRLAVFAQGCKRRCPGCHNPEALPFEGGTATTTQTLINKVIANPLLTGVTLSGGEPFDQALVLAGFARQIRKMGLTVWAYSGYTFEELSAGVPSEEARELLCSIDVLVDGPYVQEQRDLNLQWRGSANQRVIDVPAALIAKEAVLLD